MSHLQNYNNVKGYLSNNEQVNLADETIEELETALREIKRVAETFPQDKAILKITERVLGGA